MVVAGPRAAERSISPPLASGLPRGSRHRGRPRRVQRVQERLHAGRVRAIGAVPAHGDPGHQTGPAQPRQMGRDAGLREPEAGCPGAGAGPAVWAARLGGARPAAAPVPAALLASPAADIFGRLARMTDGPGHATMKRAVSATLDSVDVSRAHAHADRWARRLAAEIDPRSSPARLDQFALALSAHAIAGLLPLPDEALESVERCVRQYTGGVSPGADAAHVERGKVAAGHLTQTIPCRSTGPGPGATAGLLGVLHREASRAGCDDPAVVANAIGFLTPAYQATAGLIGNTLLALAAHPDVAPQIERAPALLSEAIRGVLRYDPPVQNTRRFIVANGLVASRRMAAGDTVLVVLAAADHRAAAEPAPERVDVPRGRRRT